ncbi:glycosyltransferase family 2 protein [Candidatus Daviesbacteria bacterium]|nr:glycosyltransferase family 2 protein [Candidatus Daviesbacteria bacterium]
MRAEVPLASVVVRTKNEESTIGRTLLAIANQSLKPHEIIVIDNASTDRTLEIAQNYTDKIINLDSRLPYNHAFACNTGIEHTTGNIAVLTNGHSTPVSSGWLQSATRHFADERVAGCSGFQYPVSRTPWELLRSKLLTNIIRSGIQGRNSISLANGIGLFNTVTGAVRRELWEKHQFDEDFSEWFCGGEDKDWAFYWYKQGYRFVTEPNFSVYHNHQGANTLKETFLHEFDYLMMYLGAYNRYKRNISGKPQEPVFMYYARGPYKED